MSEHKGRRRRIIINKAVQSRIIFAIIWPPALCLVLSAILLVIYWTRPGRPEGDLPGIVSILLVCFMLFSAGLLLFNGLTFSHRVVGPMLRIAKTLTSVREGDLTVRANLRQGDFLVEVASDLNDFLDWLQRNPPSNWADAGGMGFAAAEGSAEAEDDAESGKRGDSPVVEATSDA